MLTIQPLTGSHDRSRFECGSAALDLWLRNTARQHQQRGISRTFVAVSDDEPSRIPGYYALTACEVVTAALPESLARKLPRRIPGARLGRLAVDRSVQGQGLGELLLIDAIRRANLVTHHIGIHALFVDETAARSYRKDGFKPFPDNPLVLVLPLAGLRALD